MELIDNINRLLGDYNPDWAIAFKEGKVTPPVLWPTLSVRSGDEEPIRSVCSVRIIGQAWYGRLS